MQRATLLLLLLSCASLATAALSQGLRVEAKQPSGVGAPAPDSHLPAARIREEAASGLRRLTPDSGVEVPGTSEYNTGGSKSSAGKNAQGCFLGVRSVTRTLPLPQMPPPPCA